MIGLVINRKIRKPTRWLFINSQLLQSGEKHGFVCSFSLAAVLETLALEESWTVISTDADYPLDELAVLRLEVLVFDLPLHSSRCHVQSIHFVVELFFGGVVVGVVPPFDLCQFPK